LQLQTAYDTNFKLMVIRHAKEINRTEGTEWTQHFCGQMCQGKDKLQIFGASSTRTY
jgi:hypothetical protein